MSTLIHHSRSASEHLVGLPILMTPTNRSSWGTFSATSLEYGQYRTLVRDAGNELRRLKFKQIGPVEVDTVYTFLPTFPLSDIAEASGNPESFEQDSKHSDFSSSGGGQAIRQINQHKQATSLAPCRGTKPDSFHAA
jgi:hypothetical protein